MMTTPCFLGLMPVEYTLLNFIPLPWLHTLWLHCPVGAAPVPLILHARFWLKPNLRSVSWRAPRSVSGSDPAISWRGICSRRWTRGQSYSLRCGRRTESSPPPSRPSPPSPPSSRATRSWCCTSRSSANLPSWCQTWSVCYVLLQTVPTNWRAKHWAKKFEKRRFTKSLQTSIFFFT